MKCLPDYPFTLVLGQPVFGIRQSQSVGAMINGSQSGIKPEHFIRQFGRR